MSLCGWTASQYVSGMVVIGMADFSQLGLPTFSLDG
jgi:hypothetical protein